MTPGPLPQFNPFFSPDGRWVGFLEGSLAQATLKKVPISGGPAVTFCRATGTPSATLRVQAGKAWTGGSPIKLFERSYFTEYGGSTGRIYDVSGDGRFLLTRIIDNSQGSSFSMVVVQNWREELKRLVPAN